MAESPSKRRKLTPEDDSEEKQVQEQERAVADQPQEGRAAAMLCERPINMATANASPQLPLVVEANAFLRPHQDCDKHDKEKGKWAEVFDETCCEKPGRAQHSNTRTDALFEMHIKNDPLATLKRWLGHQNQLLTGLHWNRKPSLQRILLVMNQTLSAQDWSLMPQHLRSTIEFAVQEIIACHDHIEGMREYLGRAPYRFWYTDGPAPEAISLSKLPTTDDLAQESWDRLGQWMAYLAHDLDYLRKWEVDMWQEILFQKWWEATLGNENEIQELLRLNFVDKNMVGAYCGLPDV